MLQPRALQFLNHGDPFDPSTLAYYLFSCWIGRRSKIGVAVSTNSETFFYLVGSISYFDLIHTRSLTFVCLGDYHHPFPFGIQKCRLLVNLNEFNLNVWGKLFGKCWILLQSGDMTSFQPNVSPNCPLHHPSNLGMSLLCFFFPYIIMLLWEFSRNVPIMLKKMPIMPICHGKKVYHWRWWAACLGAILHASQVWQSSVQCRLPHSSCTSRKEG